MLRCHCQAFFCAIAFLFYTAVAAPAAPAPELAADPAAHNAFHPLPIEDPVQTLALTDDDHYLLLAHESLDKITVWDIVANKPIKTLACPAPRAMLCRNHHLYVGSYGHGKILVFDTSNWTQTDELLTGEPDVVYLSAPAGKAFSNKLLVFCRLSDRSGDSEDFASFVDISNDTHRVLENAGLATLSADGKCVFMMDRICRTRQFENWSTQGPRSPSLAQAYVKYPLIYQAGATNWICNERGAYTANDLKEAGKRMGNLVFVDQTRPAVYGLSETQLLAFNTNATLDEIGHVPAKFDGLGKPKNDAVQFRELFDSSPRRDAGDFDPPIAVTLGDTLHLFFMNPRKPIVEAATFDAFKVPDLVTTHSNESTPPDVAAADEVPSALSPQQLSTYTLLVPSNTTLTPMSMPPGMKLSGNILSWTPPADAAGSTISIKIRAEHAGSVTFIRHTFNISGVSPAVAAAADRAQRLITFPFDPTGATTGYAFAPSYDHRSLLVLTGSKLRITDPSGQFAAETHTLPRQYNHIAEREIYYVALSANTLDLIDKHTFAVIKSVPLHTSETYDLVLHPTLRIAYVALHDQNSPADASILSRRIAEVNETTGALTVIPGTYGQWLAIDPHGAKLYIGLHDLYQQGYRIDTNYDELIVPDYGDIDVLGVIPLLNGTPQRGKAIGDPGVNGRAVRVSPDGKALSYVAAAGCPVYSYAVPALDPSNLKETLATYSMKGLGGPQDLCYHPMLPLVAAISTDHVALFDRNTGDRLDDKLGPIPVDHLENMDRVLFSPDGRFVLIDPVTDASGLHNGGGRSDSARHLIAIPINLTDAERAILAKSAPPALKSTPTPDAPAPKPTPSEDTTEKQRT
jgi:hypothetical protein